MIRKIRPAWQRSCRAWRNWAGTDGRNVRIDTRWATTNGDDRLRDRADVRFGITD
jgi:hypothetical protein